ncbi:MAG TPA: phosphodiester glycosidase family protein [Longimicrobium sp.]|nr:phosphodiester glycosidase family protein [Longimicrobium sp.]
MFRPLRVAASVLGLLVASVAALTRAEPVAWKPVHPGIEHTHLVRPAPGGGGSWNIHVLRVDLAQVRLDVVHANDAAIGLEPTTKIAQRAGALAAINGGYFLMKGDFKGDSTGTLQIDGVLWSEPDRGRASVGILREGDRSRLIFGHVTWQGLVEAGRQKRSVEGLNRARAADELVAFTPRFGPATVTDAEGLEVVVRAGRVTEARDLAGGTAIPADGFVLSAHGKAREWARRALRKGTRVRLETKLVTGGRIDVTDVREKVPPEFSTTTHPRTAIASTQDGRALLLVADGRHPPERVGLALPDLASLLIELGAREAINLDGGGSTTMVVDGAIVNVPSDQTGERPVSDAIVVRPRR